MAGKKDRKTNTSTNNQATSGDDGSQVEDLTTDIRPWPALDADALYGLLGDIVRGVDPYTESDPVGILVSLVLVFGMLIGRSAHYFVGATRHRANEFAITIGNTAKTRKGTAWSLAESIVRQSAEGAVPKSRACRISSHAANLTGGAKA